MSISSRNGKLTLALVAASVLLGSVAVWAQAPMKTHDAYGLVTGVADKTLDIKQAFGPRWVSLTLRLHDDTVYAEVKKGSAADLAPGALVSIWTRGKNQKAPAEVVVIYKPAKVSRYTHHVLRSCKRLMYDRRPSQTDVGWFSYGKVKSIDGAKVALATDEGDVAFTTDGKTKFSTVTDKPKKALAKSRWVSYVMDVTITEACHGRAVVLTPRPLSVRPVPGASAMCVDCALAGLCAKHKGVVQKCADCKAKGLCGKHDKEVWECPDCSNGFCKKHKAESVRCRTCTRSRERFKRRRAHPVELRLRDVCREHATKSSRCKDCRKAPRCETHQMPKRR